MGINITVYRIGKNNRGEEQAWFDYMRYTGDKEFVMNNDFEAAWEYVDRDIDYKRPRNFSKCRQWVKENIIKGNQKRLIDALDKMEKDEKLVFSWE